jgi:hypothetical protein
MVQTIESLLSFKFIESDNSECNYLNLEKFEKNLKFIPNIKNRGELLEKYKREARRKIIYMYFKKRIKMKEHFLRLVFISSLRKLKEN